MYTMTLRIITTIFFSSIIYTALAQSGIADEQFYLGGGNSNDIHVTTSSDWQSYQGFYWATGQKTIDGSGLEGDEMEASRFLSQATFGGTESEIEYVAEIGIEKWFEEQFAKPATFISDSSQLYYELALANWVADHNGDSTGYQLLPINRHVGYAWWNNMINAEDQLRQRMAYALSEIFVTSLNTGYAISTANFYDMLIEHSFGNYRDLLVGVSTSATMGVYLSHLNNPKSDILAGEFPDENYAREIMQLFSIGLHKLNNDGSVIGGVNNPTPTYTNDDIKEMAKIFTGFGMGATLDTSVSALYFGYNNRYYCDYTVPMIMYDDYHEPGEKVLFDGNVIPAGQTGMEDFNQTIDLLFNHQNVAPFMARRLIQHFVKSNPSPEYINDVANVFADNGDGERGDLKAVLYAILTHDEARNCEWINHSTQGKLREPILRNTQFARFFGGDHIFGKRFWNYYNSFKSETDQFPLFAPTVFNFFSPSYMPNGVLADEGLVAPEFEIHTTRTSIGYADMLYRWIESEQLMYSATSDILGSPLAENVYLPQYQHTDLSALVEVSKDSDAMLDYLDLNFCNGELSTNTREIFKNQLSYYNGSSYTEIRFKLALYVIMLSPDYVILK